MEIGIGELLTEALVEHSRTGFGKAKPSSGAVILQCVHTANLPFLPNQGLVCGLEL
jgi:hypothetical protein